MIIMSLKWVASFNILVVRKTFRLWCSWDHHNENFLSEFLFEFAEDGCIFFWTAVPLFSVVPMSHESWWVNMSQGIVYFFGVLNLVSILLLHCYKVQLGRVTRFSRSDHPAAFFNGHMLLLMRPGQGSNVALDFHNPSSKYWSSHQNSSPVTIFDLARIASRRTTCALGSIVNHKVKHLHIFILWSYFTIDLHAHFLSIL